MLEIAHRVASAQRAGDDRVAILHAPGADVLIVADGSGGTSGAAEAAERAIRELAAAINATSVSEPAPWSAMLHRADVTMAGGRGQCALALVAISGAQVTGASVGDCCAWLLHDGAIEDLTERQVRKPLLGSGRALPVGFAGTLARSTLLVASDGLWKYGRRERIAAIACAPDLQVAVRDLVDLPRLLSGQLPDDIAVVLCRERHATLESVT